MRPNQKRRSFGSIGSWGSIFGVDEVDEIMLSEFQQQSLSVFESEHMWANFKAHLAESNVQTTAGLKAMLPQFVNERVLDGSVRRSERQVYPSSMRRQESFGTNSTGDYRPVYPAAMRRQESFGTNSVLYGQPSTEGSNGSCDHSLDTSGNGHSLDEYEHALRGDAKSVISLYGAENLEKETGLLSGVGRRLPRKNSLPIPFLSSTWSVINDLSVNCGNVKTLGETRPKYRRPRTYDGEDTRKSCNKQSYGSDLKITTGSSAVRLESSSEMRELLEGIVHLSEDHHEGLNVVAKNTNTKNPDTKVEKICPNPFSYCPIGRKLDRDKLPSVTSLTSSDCLLVEWGETACSSDDEEYSDDSQKAVVMNREKIVFSSNEEGKKRWPDNGMSGVVALMSSLSLELERKKCASKAPTNGLQT